MFKGGEEKKARPSYIRKQERFGLAMTTPSLLFLFAMAAFPLIMLMVMSIYTIDLTFPAGNRWVGVKNYLQMMDDSRFWHAIKVTVIYTASTVLLQVVIGLALAMAFFRGFRGEGFLRVSVLLPMILAPVVVGLAFRTMIMTPEYGILDYVSIVLGFGSKPWLVDPHLGAHFRDHHSHLAVDSLCLPGVPGQPHGPARGSPGGGPDGCQKRLAAVLARDPAHDPAGRDHCDHLSYHDCPSGLCSHLLGHRRGPGHGHGDPEPLHLPGVLQLPESGLWRGPRHGASRDHRRGIHDFFPNETVQDVGGLGGEATRKYLWLRGLRSVLVYSLYCS